MLISARLDVSKSPLRNLGSTATVRSRKCHLFRTNDGPATPAVTVTKPCEEYKGGSRKPVLGPCVWPKAITKVPLWPLRPSIQPSSLNSHDLETALGPPTWLALLGRNNPYYPFFCNKLKALFTNSINCHTVRIYGEILNYICSCKGW